ncbi:MAG TPA: hypothetical protein VFX61_12045 [Micromonosporaceae bacterium]|nr:hypothetical protein [Micromonosporaceae bacterium]
MYVVLAWFSERPVPQETQRAAQERFETAVANVVPESYVRHEFGGDDWGVTVLHRSEQGAYRWPFVATEGPVTAVSLGLPVGGDTSGGLTGMARRLLAGEDVHRSVVPPFGLVAVDGNERFAVQEDWLGMCRFFIGEAAGITALCSRPSLLGAFLHGNIEPDPHGWASYTLSAHFGGELSPIRGTRLLRPGERLTGNRRIGGGWTVASKLGYSVDDIVMAGYAAQGQPIAESLDRAAEAITATAGSIYDLYDDEIVMGLSGGKDSRLIAAALVAAGRLPRLFTNEDARIEGEVASELVQILRNKRGLKTNHELRLAAAPDNVFQVGLIERTLGLQKRYDFQFTSTYLTRPLQDPKLSNKADPALFSGVAGELASGYWYPTADAENVPSPEQQVLTSLQGSVRLDLADKDAVDFEQRRLTKLLDHAKGIGLRDLHLVDYIYLLERLRRWYSSAYDYGVVTPFLTPEFVTATFALTPEQKRDQLVHTGLIERLVPEWSHVPFVSGFTNKSTVPKIWEGDGVQAIADLIDTAHGPLANLVQREYVVKVLATAVKTGRANQRLLQQFTWLAVASHQLEPQTVRPATGETYTRLTTPPKPKPVPVQRKSGLVSRMQWVKKTKLGRQLWAAARKQVQARRAKN